MSRTLCLTTILFAVSSFMIPFSAQEPAKKGEEKKETKEPEPTKTEEEKKEKKEPDPKEVFLDSKLKELETPTQAMARLLIEDDDEVVRRRLAIAIMHKGKEGKSALPALFLAASKAEKSAEVRKAAGKAIQKFEPLEVVDALVQALNEKNQNPPRKKACCDALAIYFHIDEIELEKKKEIYELLETILIDGEVEVRQAAAKALDDIEKKKN